MVQRVRTQVQNREPWGLDSNTYETRHALKHARHSECACDSSSAEQKHKDHRDLLAPRLGGKT